MERPQRPARPPYEHEGLLGRQHRRPYVLSSWCRWQTQGGVHDVRGHVPAVPVRRPPNDRCVLSSVTLFTGFCSRRAPCLHIHSRWHCAYARADDEDAPWNGNVPDKLGSIELHVVHVHSQITRLAFKPKRFSGTGPVHERSKKAGAHCVE